MILKIGHILKINFKVTLVNKINRVFSGLESHVAHAHMLSSAEKLPQDSPVSYLAPPNVSSLGHIRFLTFCYCKRS